MNELVRKLQRMFGVPRKDFVTSLRSELLQEFTFRRPPLEESIRAAGIIEPRTDFRVRLKKQLEAGHAMPVLKRSHTNFFPRFTPRGKKVLVHALRMATSGIAAVTLIMTAVFFGWSKETLATSGTYLVDFNGTVEVERSGNRETVITADMPLAEGTIISTGSESGAEIRFFEDSVLRLDAGTTVSIDELKPHYSQDDLGFVNVSLKRGRVWTRTFAADDEFSRFTLALHEDKILNDSGSVLDATFGPGATEVRIWERSVILSGSKKNSFLPEGKKYFLKNGQKGEVFPLSEQETKEGWVTYNREKDAKLIAEFVTEKAKQQAASSAEARAILGFWPMSRPESEKSIKSLQTAFGEAISEMKESEIQSALQSLAAEVRSAHEHFAQETDAFLASAEKTLSPILPDSQLFTVKKFIESLRSEFSSAPKLVVAEQQRTERLWEARQLADAGNIHLAETIVRESSEVSSDTGGSIRPEDAENVLQEKQEQLVMLGEIQKEGIAEDAVTEIEEEILSDSSRLLRPAFPDPAPRDLNERANDIVVRVEKYESAVGQQNTLRHHLQGIEESATNLQLLAKIKNQLPEPLEQEISEHILSILDAEREKVRLTKTLPSATPCSPDSCPQSGLTPDESVAPNQPTAVPESPEITASPALSPSQTPAQAEASPTSVLNMSSASESAPVDVPSSEGSLQVNPESAAFFDGLRQGTPVFIPDSLE